jgi:hypothetical protein
MGMGMDRVLRQINNSYLILQSTAKHRVDAAIGAMTVSLGALSDVFTCFCGPRAHQHNQSLLRIGQTNSTSVVYDDGSNRPADWAHPLCAELMIQRGHPRTSGYHGCRAALANHFPTLFALG